jgi:hypothetical protein
MIAAKQRDVPGIQHRLLLGQEVVFPHVRQMVLQSFRTADFLSAGHSRPVDLPLRRRNWTSIA